MARLHYWNFKCKIFVNGLPMQNAHADEPNVIYEQINFVKGNANSFFYS